MKAVLFTRYGPPEALELHDVPRPVPGEDQVLIKVVAASANALDWRPLTFPPLILRLLGGGRSKPKDPTFGVDAAGIIEAVGAKVTQFRPGNEVFGVATGAFAEYACADQAKIALKPADVPFDFAAATPVAGCSALQALRDKGNLQPGQHILIYGASGGVGTFAVQIAKAFQARVTAVCSGKNVEMLRSIGADEVMDYEKEDFAKDRQRYDLIIAVNGYHPILQYWRAVKPDGACIVVGGSFAQIVPALVLGPLLSKTASKRMQFMIANSNQKDLLFLADLLDQKRVVPVIDRRYPLPQVPEAMRYLIEDHPRGKVVITT